MAGKKRNLPKKAHTTATDVVIKIGRPTTYSEAFVDFICDKIASSSEGIQTILEKYDNMPHPSVCYKWLTMYPYFKESYARAREMQADYLADKIIEVANTPIEMTIKEDGINGYGAYSKTTTADAVAHRRLVIDAMKWKAAKLFPKKYSEKVDLTTDGEKIKQTTVIKWGDKTIEV